MFCLVETHRLEIASRFDGHAEPLLCQIYQGDVLRPAIRPEARRRAIERFDIDRIDAQHARFYRTFIDFVSTAEEVADALKSGRDYATPIRIPSGSVA
jgi:hypothetical protein